MRTDSSTTLWARRSLDWIPAKSGLMWQVHKIQWVCVIYKVRIHSPLHVSFCINWKRSLQNSTKKPKNVMSIAVISSYDYSGQNVWLLEVSKKTTRLTSNPPPSIILLLVDALFKNIWSAPFWNFQRANSTLPLLAKHPKWSVYKRSNSMHCCVIHSKTIQQENSSVLSSFKKLKKTAKTAKTTNPYERQQNTNAISTKQSIEMQSKNC